MKTVEIRVEVPEEVSEEILSPIKAKAKKAAIIALWDAGVVSTRWAAKELGLYYYDFLDLLAAEGVSIVRKGPDIATVSASLKKLKNERLAANE